MNEEDTQQMVEGLNEGKEEALVQFQQHAPCQHWASFYLAARMLFLTDRKDEAVFWFYVGQLRGRVAAAFDPDPSASPALLGALNEMLGQPINQHAGSDLKKWIAAIDRALAWDQQHPYGPDNAETTVDPADWQEKYAQVREGLGSMRQQLAETDPEEFRRQRQANGLE